MPTAGSPTLFGHASVAEDREDRDDRDDRDDRPPCRGRVGVACHVAVESAPLEPVGHDRGIAHASPHGSPLPRVSKTPRLPSGAMQMASAQAEGAEPR
jgi:hypothetical protein